MKALTFFPLAYLAGVHGFALFAPYAATFLVIAHFLRRSRQAKRAQLVPITPKMIHESARIDTNPNAFAVIRADS